MWSAKKIWFYYRFFRLYKNHPLLSLVKAVGLMRKKKVYIEPSYNLRKGCYVVG